MKWKKMTALFLCGAMTAGLFAGCAKGEEKKGENKDKKEVRGGYVEEELKGPWGEEELYLGSFLNKEKQLSVYTQKEQEGEGIKVVADIGFISLTVQMDHQCLAQRNVIFH